MERAHNLSEAKEMTIYNLLYVGQGLYSVPQFEAEAEKHGVARAMPARIVKTLKWGDSILLAQWVPDREKQRDSRQTQTTLEGQEGTVHYKRFGSANVFGYFNVTGLNMGNVPDEAKKALTSMLRVVRIQDHGPGGMPVTRRCGSYVVGSTAFVDDTIEEILTKAAEVEQAMDVKFKWFVTGPFTKIDEIVLDPAKFSRGVVKVEVEGYLPEGEFEPGVSFVYDYKRKMYQPKETDT